MYKRKSKELNKRTIKKFNKIRSNVKELDQYRNEGTADMKDRLVSREAPDTSEKDRDARYEEMLKKLDEGYSKKFDGMLKGMENQEKLANNDKKAYNESLNDLYKQNADLRKAISSVADSNKQAYESLAEGEKPTNPSTPQTAPDPMAANIDSIIPSSDSLIEKTISDVSKDTEQIEEDKKEEGAVTQVNASNVSTSKNTSKKKSVVTLNKNQRVQIGDHNITITNLFGIRSGGNAVSGVPTTEHSKGIDYVADNGGAIAIDDGVIVGVYVQEPREPTHPRDGRGAGYYVRVKNTTTGLYTDYMHLDAMTDGEMKSMKNKKVKRGEQFWTAEVGSGSITDPHVKVSQFKNMDTRRAEKAKYDPSEFFI